LKLGMHLPEVQTWGQLQWPHRVAKSPCVMQEELPEARGQRHSHWLGEGDLGTGAAGEELKLATSFPVLSLICS